MNLIHLYIFTHKKAPDFSDALSSNGDPGGTRTPDPLIRSQIL